MPQMEKTYPAGTKYTWKVSDIFPVFNPFIGKASARMLMIIVTSVMRTTEICLIVFFIFTSYCVRMISNMVSCQPWSVVRVRLGVGIQHFTFLHELNKLFKYFAPSLKGKWAGSSKR